MVTPATLYNLWDIVQSGFQSMSSLGVLAATATSLMRCGGARLQSTLVFS
jgi:hypothetical protein